MDTLEQIKTFNFDALLRPDLPPPAARWNGFPKFNFVGGHNDADCVPVDGLIRAATTVLQREGKTLSTYGLQSGPLGYRPLREFIAAKLAKDAAMRCSADEILITCGSLHGLDLVNAVLLSPGDTVIVERATYGGAITRLTRLGVNIIGVALDHDGLSASELKKTLADLKSRGVRPKYIYTIPTVQNPTATIMSEARRAAILALTEEYDVPIFEDDCYADLTWNGARPRAIYAMAKDDRVIHIGSFSKSIAPALRTGFLVASWPIMSRILAIKNDGGTGALEQMVLAEYCASHFDHHLVDLRKALRLKVGAMMDALRTHFGSDATFDDPAGGIFLWVTFPEKINTTELTRIALQAGVAINPGVEWMTDTVAGQTRVRLCFAHPSELTIRAGVEQLAQISRDSFGIPAQRAPAHH